MERSSSVDTATNAPMSGTSGNNATAVVVDMPQLPQEILDAIIDDSRTDRSTLKALALTSRCFAHRALDHLHHTLYIKPRVYATHIMPRYRTTVLPDTDFSSKTHVRALVVGERELPIDNRHTRTRDSLSQAICEARRNATFARVDNVHSLVRCFPRLEVLDLQCHFLLSPPRLAIPIVAPAVHVLRLRALRLWSMFFRDRQVTMRDVRDAEFAFYEDTLRTVDFTSVSVLALCVFQTADLNEILSRCSGSLQHILLECKLLPGHIGPVGRPPDFRHNTALRSIHVKITCNCASVRASHTASLQFRALECGFSTIPAAAAATIREMNITIAASQLTIDEHLSWATLCTLIKSIPRRQVNHAGARLNVVLRWHIYNFEMDPDDLEDEYDPFLVQQLKDSWSLLAEQVRAACPDVSVSWKSPEFRCGMGPPEEFDTFRLLAGHPTGTTDRP